MVYLVVLSYFKVRNGDIIVVGSFFRGVLCSVVVVFVFVFFEDFNSFKCVIYVRVFSNGYDVSFVKSFGFVIVDFVLGCVGQSNVDFVDECLWVGIFDVFEVFVGGDVEFGKCVVFDFEFSDGVDLFGSDGGVVFGDDGILGVGERDNGGIEFKSFESGVLSDIVGVGDGDVFVFEGVLVGVLEYVLNVVDGVVVSSFCNKNVVSIFYDGFVLELIFIRMDEVVILVGIFVSEDIFLFGV